MIGRISQVHMWLRSNMNTQQLKTTAAIWRATCLKMSITGRHGHLSSSLSYIDILAFLYKEWLKLDSSANQESDRFLLSKGHGCTALYVALADCGFIDKSLLATYAQTDSPIQSHPCKHALNILENSSGSLGHALGIASGYALAQKLQQTRSNIVVLMGDGETNEGSIWEAAMFIQAQKLNNIIAIVDYNGIQAVGKTDEIAGSTNLAEKFESFGWHTEQINGNCFEEISNAFKKFDTISDKPKMLLAKTHSGISFMSNSEDALWHYRVPSEEEYQLALTELKQQPLV